MRLLLLVLFIISAAAQDDIVARFAPTLSCPFMFGCGTGALAINTVFPHSKGEKSRLLRFSDFPSMGDQYFEDLFSPWSPPCWPSG